MKRIFIIALLFTLTSSVTRLCAQYAPRITSGVDVGTGWKDEQWAPSFLYHEALHFPKVPVVQILWGIRGYGFYANSTSLLGEGNGGKEDTLRLGKVSNNGVSFVLGVNFKLAKWVELGANVDVAGIAFGTRRSGLYKIADVKTVPDSIAELHNTLVKAAPGNFNVIPNFLKGGNGQGEAFVRFWFGQRFGLKLGYTINQVTYQTKERLNNGNRSFSKYFGMPSAALSFSIF